MKTLALTSILSFLISAIQAQVINKDWSPFPFGQVGYYKDATNSFYTISADSMRANGTDTLVFINRKLFPGEALCTQPGATTWKNSSFSFSMDSFLVRGDTVLFYEDSLTLSAFNFNQPLIAFLNLNTTCDNLLYVYDSAYFDASLNDSVRVISVPYTYPSYIALNSKHHGLLHFQLNDNFVVCGTGNTYDLCGFKNDSVSWGFQPPTMGQYYNYYPGDILEYYDFNYEMNYQTLITYERDSIISKSDSGNILSFNIYAHIVQRNFTFGQDSIDTVINALETQQYNLTDFNRICNRTNNEPAFMDYTNDTSQSGGVYSVTLAENTSFCMKDTLMTINNTNGLFLADCIEGVNTDGIPEVDYYSTIFGCEGSYTTYFDGYDQINLIGYKSVVKNIACGQYYPLGVKSVAVQPLVIFPNPCGDILNISGEGPNEYFVIYDMLGKERKKIICNNSSSVIDVSTLESGIYILRGVSSTKEEEGVFSVIR